MPAPTMLHEFTARARRRRLSEIQAEALELGRETPRADAGNAAWAIWHAKVRTLRGETAKLARLVTRDELTVARIRRQRVHTKERAALPLPEPEKEPPAPADDQRERIRESKAFESTTGPPDPKMAKAPFERGPQALDRFGQDVGQDVLQQPEFNSAREFLHPLFSGTLPRARYFSPEALADLELARKIIRLARSGERPLVEFFLEFSAACLQRTRLEMLLDHYLDQGS